MEEPVLAKSAKYIGQPVAMIASGSRDRSLLLSEQATMKMKAGSEVEGIFSLDEAILKNSLHSEEFTIVEKGDLTSTENLIKIEGEIDINPQARFQTNAKTFAPSGFRVPLVNLVG